MLVLELARVGTNKERGSTGSHVSLPLRSTDCLRDFMVPVRTRSGDLEQTPDGLAGVLCLSCAQGESAIERAALIQTRWNNRVRSGGVRKYCWSSIRPCKRVDARPTST